ncbi:DNA polymerase IV [bacterium]|nr:DNA polymerase IV [bacterium]
MNETSPSGIATRKKKVILHMDGDAFFVGVEVAKNPKLRGLPVVTGEERGIVSALSYEAKAIGIIRGMPIYRVQREFPSVIIMPGDYAAYARYSSMMFDIVRRYADDVEEYSIDECFADLTGLDRPLKMSYLEIAQRIKREIQDELQLSVSIGLAPTKVLAKVASKWKKPNGLTVIERASIMDFLSKTPIEKVWGIGPKTSEALWRKGVRMAGDFIARDLAWVRSFFSVPYETIWQELNGISVMELDPRPKTVYSSMQRTRSFHPATNDESFLISQLSKHTEDVCSKARHFSLYPRKVTFFLKTKDFKIVASTVTLPSPTNAPEIINPLAKAEFRRLFSKNVLYRTTGVIIHELFASSAGQADLFGGSTRANKFELIHGQIDFLEKKFGKRTVYLASTHAALQEEVKGTDSDDPDRHLLFL